MLEVYHFSQTEIMAFLLVLARISAFFVTWPVLSVAAVPPYLKILFSMAVSFMMFPLVAWKNLDPQLVEEFYFFILIKEVFVGIVMGFVARMFFFGIEICGQFVSDSMGLSSAQILNPMADARTSVIEQYYLILVTMFYLMMDGHHYFIAGLFKSFQLVPISTIGISFQGFGHSGEFLQAVVVMGLKLAAPIVASLFAMNIAMGVIGRAVPQMNVLITSLSVNALVGLFIMFISLPMMLEGLPNFLNETVERVFQVLKAF